MTHVCTDGGAGALISSDLGALTVWACAICGAQGSDQACQIGKPHGTYATGTCRACARFTCSEHRSRKSHLCDRCQTKVKLTVVPPGRGPRYGRWQRTGDIHQ